MAKWMTTNLEDRIASGDYIRGLTVDKIPYIIDAATSTDVIMQDRLNEKYFQCPGCKHMRADFAIVDCRSITDPSLAGRKWMCCGCWSLMVHESGKRDSVFEKLAEDVKTLGPNSKFAEREALTRDLLQRKTVREKSIDDLIARTADALSQVNHLYEVDTLQIDLPRAMKVDPLNVGDTLTQVHVGNFLMHRKMTDGVLIKKRTLMNMTLSLWLELHNAPLDMINRFKGKRFDFLP